MQTLEPRELVEKYLAHFSGCDSGRDSGRDSGGDSGRGSSRLGAGARGPDRDLLALEHLLAADVVIKSPLGSFTSSRVFLDDVARDRLMIDGLTVEQILTEGNQVSVRYRLRSRDPAIGEVLVSEWFTVTAGKITAVTSSFDATAIRSSMMQI